MRILRVLAAGAVIGMGSAAMGAVEVKVFRVEESRSVALLPDTIGRSSDRLKLTLELSGAEAEAAVRFGNLKIAEAVDDKGEKMEIAKDSFHSAGEFRDYSNAFFRKFALEQKRKADEPQVEIELAPSKRTAAKISHLKGTFELAQQGTIKTVELGGLDKPGTYTMNVPAEAGLKIGVTIATKGTQSIQFTTAGDENAMESLEVVDGAGEKVSGGTSTMRFGNIVKKSLELNKPVDATMKLVAKVSMNRKMVKVAFDLKDVPLP